MRPLPIRSLSTRSNRARSRGFGLVEIMVGVVIGLLALLIIYQALALSEGYRRTTTAGGDAQSTGMISSFLLAQDLGNAGNTIADTAQDLITCDPALTFAANLRPIPVLIQDGGAPNVSDSVSVYYGVNRRLVTQVATRPPVHLAGAPLLAQSPMGWAVGQSFVIANTAPIAVPRCEVGLVTGLAGPDAGGVITITHSGVVNAYQQPSWIVNLGPANQVRKVTYDVLGDAVRVTNLLDVAPVPNPIASNIVLMKAQYGIDTTIPPNGSIDAWVSGADAGWTPNDVLNAPIAQLKRILAVRFALVVRSSQFERTTDAEGRLVANPALAADFMTTLFACNGLAGCTGELPAVTIPGTANFRYRVYEQVVPLRNQIWNP